MYSHPFPFPGFSGKQCQACHRVRAPPSLRERNRRDSKPDLCPLTSWTSQALSAIYFLFAVRGGVFVVKNGAESLAVRIPASTAPMRLKKNVSSDSRSCLRPHDGGWSPSAGRGRSRATGGRR